MIRSHETEACRALWASVLYHALLDWARAKKAGEDKRHPDIGYIDSREFDRVCGLAGIDAEATRKRISTDPLIIERLTRREPNAQREVSE